MDLALLGVEEDAIVLFQSDGSVSLTDMGNEKERSQTFQVLIWIFLALSFNLLFLIRIQWADPGSPPGIS